MPNPTLTQVSGIGPMTARVLAENGFTTVDSLATTTIEDLARVPGFGSTRAAETIGAAQAILRSGSKPSVSATADRGKKGKDKKSKDKKKKKKKKKKRKKGRKDKKDKKGKVSNKKKERKRDGKKKKKKK